MKVAYFGGDMFFSCFKSILDKGFDVVKVYINEPICSAVKISHYCEKLGIEQVSTRPCYEDLLRLIDDGVELFVVASYKFKLPQTRIKYAINIHPTLLPAGRGPTPLPYVVEAPSLAGVTIHKLSDEFDAGDIIIQEKLLVCDEESSSSIMVKTSLIAGKLITKFLNNMEKTYGKAVPQSSVESSYYPLITVEDRALKWGMDIDQIRSLVRRFGHWGIFMKINNNLALIRNIETRKFEHEMSAGTIIYEDCDLLAIAVIGGFICIPSDRLF